MIKLKDITIRKKLTFATLMISGFALLIACATFIAYEYFAFTGSMVRNLSNIAGVIESNTVSALDSHDYDGAMKTLNSLALDPNIAAASIHLPDGEVFASYNSSAESGGRNYQLSLDCKSVLEENRPLPGEKSAHAFHGKYLHLFWNIEHKGEVIGTLGIQSSLAEVDVRIGRYCMIVFTVFSGCMVMIYVLSSNVRKLIVNPILELANIAKKISIDKNYSVRAEKKNNDEIGVLTDAFNNMLEKIQRRDNALESSNKELQAFAYVASHDLQEPLRKIIAFGDRVKAKSADVLSEQARDYLDRMQNAAGRMQELIEALLNYSRVTTKASPYKEVDMSDVVKDVLIDLEMRIEEVDGKVDVNELPTIHADPVQMRQLMQNLIGNALKYHRDDVPARVRVSSTYSGGSQDSGWSSIYDDQCLISVEDNGIGFDNKYKERIFGIFQRLHGRNEYTGTGVGLAISRKIVERHGGTIAADSQPGEGARFSVRLPVTLTSISHEPPPVKKAG
jgi:signal transduction histidine kinase